MSNRTSDYIIADIDEQDYLNGSGARKMVVRRRKQPGFIDKMYQHCQSNSKIYFCFFLIAFIILGVFLIKQKQHGEKRQIQSGAVYQKHQEKQSSVTRKQKKNTKSGAQTSKSSKPMSKIIEEEVSKKVAELQKKMIKSEEQNFQKFLEQQQKELKQKKPQKDDSKNKKQSNEKKQSLTKNKVLESVSEKKIVQKLKKRSASSSSKRPIANITLVQRNNAILMMEFKKIEFSKTTQITQQQKIYYDQKYHTLSYQKELPFCIVVPSYNNNKQQRHINNIRSIVMQEYKNYHIVFIDDASTDGTGHEVQNFLKNNQTKLPKSQYLVIKNKKQQRAMPNLRMAARKYCKPEEIFLIVDGDDQLLGRQVLKLFNAVFQKQDAWFVYTNFLDIRGNIGFSRPYPTQIIKNNRYRTYQFFTSHLRAFYTALFLNIKEKDLQDEKGNYLKAANDVAICVPILEMSHERVKYVPELTYYYNSNTGQNNHQVRLKEQKSNDRMLRKRAKYQALDKLPIPEKESQHNQEDDDSGMRAPLPPPMEVGRLLSSGKNM